MSQKVETIRYLVRAEFTAMLHDMPPIYIYIYIYIYGGDLCPHRYIFKSFDHSYFIVDENDTALF